MKNILFCSFYTDDEYYRSQKIILEKKLDALSVQHEIRLLEVPDGMSWSDICRKKIPFIADVCEQNPDKIVFWIDVDCYIDRLPDFLKNFSADIIGFARGFSSPLRVGYHIRSRFWEPSLIGINTGPMARKFIRDAAALEIEFSEQATDDYFFEESWRKNCDAMGYQIIPSSERLTDKNDSGFFVFGSSGNVDDYIDKVAQHSRMNEVLLSQLMKNKLKEFLTKIGVIKPAKRVVNFFRSIFAEVKGLIHKENNSVINLSAISRKRYKLKALTFASLNQPEELKAWENIKTKFLTSDQADIIHQARSILEYKKSESGNKKNIPLCWWFNPEPGNMGDWLSPYIISKLSGRGVNLITPNKLSKAESPVLVSVGSIAKFANEKSIVLGAGVSRRDTKLEPNAVYLSVRGPLTGEVLTSCGGVDPCVYGDPAIIMPKLYQSKRAPNGRALLVRHFSHIDAPVSLPDNFDEVSILVSSSKGIEKFIDTLHQYDFVVTSAMHCYILCHSYGIPCTLVVWPDFEGAVAGDGLKYHDYALGVGLEPVSPQVIPLDFRAWDFENSVSEVQIDSKRIDRLFEFMNSALNDRELLDRLDVD